MKYVVTEKIRDIANKWRIRVLVNERDTIFLKFKDLPTSDQIDLEVDRYLSMLKERSLVKEEPSITNKEQHSIEA